jgi:hypothetical protein
MFKHGKLRWALALAVPAIAALMLAVGASADPGPNLSFGSSNDGASAAWSNGKGSAIDLIIGSSSGSFAEAKLHQLHFAVSDLSEPTFTTSNYAAGSPRFFVTLNNGDTLWGYPGLDNGDFGWAINNGNTYMSWSDVQTAEAGATATAAYVIADADQAAGTIDEITGLQFGDNSYN